MEKIKVLLSFGNDYQNYIDALEAMGVEPTAKYLPDVDTSYDGLILCGGCDLNPARYGEAVDGAVNIDDKRDEAEFELLRAYAEAGKPVLGICRGHQLINVFFGGSLYQHLPETDLHRSKDTPELVHEVSATKDGIVGKLYGERFPVNSVHHQAIKVLGSGLTATAFWEGLYVEAVEHESLPILGVQWHPERMCFKKQRDDTVCGADILRYFVDLCKARRADV